ncbi:MAG: VWA domain-containing protein [Caldilineaceae bacterium]|nr:VWA domain-containing protein [Caldilineaceae bacterium]
MSTKIRPQVFLTIILIVSILSSACAPLAPGGYNAPSAPSGAGASSSGEGRGGGNERAAPAEEVASEAPAAASGGAAADSAGRGDYRPRYPAPTAVMPDRTSQYEAVTAGVTDDNEEWQDYLDYLNRNRSIYANQRDVSERYIITVVDESGATVHDATVQVYADDVELFSGRTDAGGRVLFHPLALYNSWQAQRSRDYRVVATKGYVARSETFARYQTDRWTITIGEPDRLSYAQLDLLFLIDATGSMGDEINKLKATMADIADQIAVLPEQPGVRYGLVAYRDRGDAFVVRSYDFTPRLDDFQRTLAALRADGGGDEPEALNEALHRTIHDLSWRDHDTVRLVILVADAPPHLDYRWEPFSYDTDMIEAVRRGIKIFPVGASNLNAEGEYIFRQLAQFTGGKFVFLTYADGSNPRSGPGTETDHDVDTYSVDTLDRLVVRLVREELAQLGSGQWDSGQAGAGVVRQQPSPVPTPTPQPPLQPISCVIEAGWSGCTDNLVTARVVTLVEHEHQGFGVHAFDLDPRNGYDRVRFDITYVDAPAGVSVDIVDQPGPIVWLTPARVLMVRDELQVYDYRPDTVQASQRERLLTHLPAAVAAGETISLEIRAGRVAVNSPVGIDVVESPTLFGLDFHGNPDHTIYATFNRDLDNQDGAGVGTVVVTLYPAQ